MCEVAMQYGIKTYVDEMDNAVSEAYASMPDRLYLVGTDGSRVAHRLRGCSPPTRAIRLQAGRAEEGHRRVSGAVARLGNAPGYRPQRTVQTHLSMDQPPLPTSGAAERFDGDWFQEQMAAKYVGEAS